jgi:hypothetical protein
MYRIEKTRETEIIYRSLFSVTELALDLVRTYTPDNKKDREDAYASIKRISHTQKCRCQDEYKNFMTSKDVIYKFVNGVHSENSRQLYYRIKIILEKNSIDEKELEISLVKTKKQLNELAEDEANRLSEELFNN